jgi:hypothetical protein
MPLRQLLTATKFGTGVPASFHSAWAGGFASLPLSPLLHRFRPASRSARCCSIRHRIGANDAYEGQRHALKTPAVIEPAGEHGLFGLSRNNSDVTGLFSQPGQGQARRRRMMPWPGQRPGSPEAAFDVMHNILLSEYWTHAPSKSLSAIRLFHREYVPSKRPALCMPAFASPVMPSGWRVRVRVQVRVRGRDERAPAPPSPLAAAPPARPGPGSRWPRSGS